MGTRRNSLNITANEHVYNKKGKSYSVGDLMGIFGFPSIDCDTYNELLIYVFLFVFLFV